MSAPMELMMSPFRFAPPLAEYATLMPEIIVIVTMIVLLLMPVLPVTRSLTTRSAGPLCGVTVAGLLLAAIAAGWQLVAPYAPVGPVLSGMITHDPTAGSFKVVLHVFAASVVGLWWCFSARRTAIADVPDFLCLILGAVVGMSLMSMASNLLMIILAIEAASLPSYALVGFDKHTRRGAEASLKYVVFGAAASSMMIFGVSMFYAEFGTLDLSTLGLLTSAAWQGEAGVGLHAGVSAGFLIGWLGLLAGIGFKLAATPLHFWCPDAFEAAPIEVTTFLSVASKGAAIVLLLRAVASFGVPVAMFDTAGAAGAGTPASPAELLSWVIGAGGLVTAFWGNLTAYQQTNLKRLLAYSSIAHAGYMMMAAGLATATTTPESTAQLAHAIVLYVLVYAFMNFGAFAVIAVVVEASDGDESMSILNGLMVRKPLLGIALGVFLMGLFGLPGTGGFWAKVMLGIQMAEQGTWGYILVAGLVVNTLLSLYFYLRPIIAMVFVEPPREAASSAPAATAAAPGVAHHSGSAPHRHDAARPEGDGMLPGRPLPLHVAAGPVLLIALATAGVLGVGVLGPDRVPAGWLGEHAAVVTALPTLPAPAAPVTTAPLGPAQAELLPTPATR